MAPKLLPFAVAAVSLFLATLFYQLPDPSKGVLFYYVTRPGDDLTILNGGVSDLPLPAEDLPMAVIVHGYTEHGKRAWIPSVYNAYLTRWPGAVVIVVDYWHLTTIARPHMNQNINTIARTIAGLFDDLVTQRNFPLSRVQIFCFSMGGRIVGGVSSYRKTSQQIGQIIGIDPSMPWPGYKPLEPSDYLDDSDARVVTVLKGSRLSRDLNASREVVFNGGLVQTGCSWYQLKVLMDICSHNRPRAYVEEAIRDPEAFLACPCEGPEAAHCPPCDISVNFIDRALPKGKYFIETNGAAPYSRSS